jgi:pimeloyl-ACP methyl ester carboxylesterase
VSQYVQVTRRLLPACRAVPALVLALLAAGCAGSSTSASPAPSAAPGSASATPSAAASGRPTTSPAPSTAAVPPLAWTGCRDGFQCATLTVPLDYADTTAGTVKLRVIRLPASRPAQRVGSLLINPGGPGVSAVDFLRGFAKGSAPAVLRQRFDLVAFDPRGTTGSAPVHCLDTAGLDRYFHVDQDPDTPAEVQAFHSASVTFAAGCRARSGRILPHLSTAVAARDMDSVRAALREPKLTYLGYSYGTALGAAYLDQFPTHVRAMVLDGALDPRISWDQLATGQAKGFEQAFGSFIRWCDGHASQCDFRRAVTGDLGTAFDRIRARVEQSPLPGDGRRTVGPSELFFGTGQAMYSTAYWEFLGTALADAAKGDGNVMLQLSDIYLDRTDTGYANSLEANFAVNCVDRPFPKDDAAYQRLAQQLAKVAPRFGPAIGWGSEQCALWPVPATGRPHAVRGTGSPPIVVVGTTRDPATPYVWAQALAAQLDRGVLITFDGDGHTAYRASAPACITGPINTYLVTGRAPAPTRC